jgi:hypothetical protein
MLTVELRHALRLSNTRNYSLADYLARWHIRLENGHVSASPNSKGGGGTSSPTSLIRRLSVMPLLEAECASSVS